MEHQLFNLITGEAPAKERRGFVSVTGSAAIRELVYKDVFVQIIMDALNQPLTQLKDGAGVSIGVYALRRGDYTEGVMTFKLDCHEDSFLLVERYIIDDVSHIQDCCRAFLGQIIRFAALHRHREGCLRPIQK